MAVETLIQTRHILEKPYRAFYVAVGVTLLAFILSIKILPEYSSLVFVTFICIPLIPLIISLVSREEISYEIHQSKIRRSKFIQIYSYLFLGIIVTSCFLYIVAPDSVTDQVFRGQIRALYELESPRSFATFCPNCQVIDVNSDGIVEFVDTSRNNQRIYFDDGQTQTFSAYVGRMIFMHNLQILSFIFLLSFIFSAGALLVIAWNATILGVFFGDAIQQVVNALIGGNVFTPSAINIVTIWIHGIPEFLAFFIAAMVGGVLGRALIKRSIQSPQFKHALIEIVQNLFLAVLLLAAAAIIETIWFF
jgi:uncharacterized membrane protein SpoIIM required for sporulation